MLPFSRLSALVLLVGTSSVIHAADQIRPGLWEFTQQSSMAGQQMPDMQQMMAQLNSLPPAQRQMMEQMLAQQGVRLGQQGVQLCLTGEQLKEGIPMPDQEGCTQQVTERGDGVWKFHYRCPDSTGEGEVTFKNEREFITRMHGTVQHNGKPQPMEMQSHGRWVSDDCGNLKPAR